MKVTYLAYLRLIKEKPSQKAVKKIIPGDNVIVSDDLKDFFTPEEVVSGKDSPDIVTETCEKCKKIKIRCVCKRLELLEQRKQQMLDAITPEEKQEKENEKLIINVDSKKVDKILEKKKELKKSSLSKIEQKEELIKFKEELEKEKPEIVVEKQEVEEKIIPKEEVTIEKEEKNIPKEEELKLEIHNDIKPKKKKSTKKKSKIKKDPKTGEFYKSEE